MNLPAWLTTSTVVGIIGAVLVILATVLNARDRHRQQEEDRHRQQEERALLTGIDEKIEGLLSGTLTGDEMSELLDSLASLFRKDRLGGRQIDLSMRLLKGDVLLAERYVAVGARPTATQPDHRPRADLQRTRIEIVPIPVGGGAPRNVIIPPEAK